MPESPPPEPAPPYPEAYLEGLRQRTTVRVVARYTVATPAGP